MSKELLYNLSELLPEIFRQKNIDFLDIFTYCKLKFARNLFKSKCHFKNNKFYLGKFDYEYVNDNGTDKLFLQMQSKLTYFRKIYRSQKWNCFVEDEYIDYIDSSMQVLINEIIQPILDVAPKYRTLIEKYKENKDTKPKRSNKINYEALKALGIEFD
jgi:hypothetical protein